MSERAENNKIVTRRHINEITGELVETDLSPEQAAMVEMGLGFSDYVDDDAVRRFEGQDARGRIVSRLDQIDRRRRELEAMRAECHVEGGEDLDELLHDLEDLLDDEY